MEQTFKEETNQIGDGGEAATFSSDTTRTKSSDSSTQRNSSDSSLSEAPVLTVSFKDASDACKLVEAPSDTIREETKPAGNTISTSRLDGATDDSTEDEEASSSSSDRQKLRKGKWTVCTFCEGSCVSKIINLILIQEFCVQFFFRLKRRNTHPELYNTLARVCWSYQMERLCAPSWQKS
jgi:hypothetical protein